MWAVNLTEYCKDHRLGGWAPATAYLEAIWMFCNDLDEAPVQGTETLIGQDRAELMGLLGMKYLVPESSLCTRIGNDRPDGTIYVSGKGYVSGCYVSQYPVYTGESWEDALAIAQRIPKLIMPKKLVPQEYQPTGWQVTTAFDGVFGCERFKADSYLLLWHNPARALKILKLRARQNAGLIKPRKPGTDYYRLLMECLRTVVSEHHEAFHLPRKFQDVIKMEDFSVSIVGKRSKCKDDPAAIMAWVLQCHNLYRLMDRGAFNRLGKARYYYNWCRPPMTYRKAIKTLVRKEVHIRECVKKYFKPRKWKPFLAWVRGEERRLWKSRRIPAVEVKKAA